LVDDNLVGNKTSLKIFLQQLLVWSRARGFPFFFTAEASLNLADDLELLGMLRDNDFRVIFLGIETPDPDLLRAASKSTNVTKPLVERIQRLYDHGLLVSGGFILGFDGEKPGAGQAIIQCVEDTAIGMAMVGLLVALPGTRLTRRLLAEGRLLDSSGRTVGEGQPGDALLRVPSNLEHADQTTSGLNFRTKRDCLEVFDEYAEVLTSIYAVRPYMDRVLRLSRRLKGRRRKLPKGEKGWFEIRALFRIFHAFWKHPEARWLFLRNFLLIAPQGTYKLDLCLRVMSLWLHFSKQTQASVDAINARRGDAINMGWPRSV
jgi:radical SAM superfamily enzyme YgiQ (UPF0313 family)